MTSYLTVGYQWDKSMVHFNQKWMSLRTGAYIWFNRDTQGSRILPSTPMPTPISNHPVSTQWHQMSHHHGEQEMPEVSAQLIMASFTVSGV
jgi:hypothetical protein